MGSCVSACVRACVHACVWVLIIISVCKQLSINDKKPDEREIRRLFAMIRDLSMLQP